MLKKNLFKIINNLIVDVTNYTFKGLSPNNDH